MPEFEDVLKDGTVEATKKKKKGKLGLRSTLKFEAIS